MRQTLLCLTLTGLLAGNVAAQTPDFGDDRSTWANDGECDDPRFVGPGMTNTPLLDEDRGHDASDCRRAWNAGRIQLPQGAGRKMSDGIDFGDDASDWANDGECDDPRFTGPGMTETALFDQDRGHDASDCRSAWLAGQLSLANPEKRMRESIDFGDNSSNWANDGECDDPRFVGSAMATTLVDADLGHDANDCRKAYQAGLIRLR
jgi:hypothetical protein